MPNSMIEVDLPTPSPTDSVRVENALRSWRRRLVADHRRVVILDDDPTGTQTSSDVDVLLDCDRAEIARFLDGPDRSVFVLTNSRALEEAEATALVRRIAALVEEEASARSMRATILLRGDSTLRGHVFAEIDALGGPDHVALFCPAFPEGGRVTVGGRHLLLREGRWVPVSATEFASDPVFGYHSELMVDWVRERGHRPGRLVKLDLLRDQGPAVITRAIEEAQRGEMVIPETVDAGDIAVIAEGILDAENSGARLVVRSGASLASTRAGLQARPLQDLARDAARVLIVCGSHTEAATKQLDAVVSQLGVAPVFIPTTAALGPSQPIVRELAELRDRLRVNGVAILSTERTRRAEHDTLAHGAAVMARLVEIVARLQGLFDVIITKGGITSAEVAHRSLEASHARVRGQLAPGVPVWDVVRPDGEAVPQVIVPGNVGGPDTLIEMWRRVSTS